MHELPATRGLRFGTAPVAFYNEHDPAAAAWLRELIAAGLIAPGVVDERDIQQLREHDFSVYTQVHLFAGIGGWSLALRLAGWPDDRPVWTGSCPCQPFSAAGKQKGTKDARHLWPWMRHLMFRWCPAIAFGEQVASGLGREWLAGVRANLETLGYVVGAADLCAAGVAAPHIRQRVFWVADAGHDVQPRSRQGRRVEAAQRAQSGIDAQPGRVARRMGDAIVAGLEGHAGYVHHGNQPGRLGTLPVGSASETGAACRMADASGSSGPEHEHYSRGWTGGGSPDPAERSATGFWSAYDLIPCRDDKTRRVEPGTFPLAHGVSGRLGLLRGYGNAIVPQVAASFIVAYEEVRERAARAFEREEASAA